MSLFGVELNHQVNRIITEIRLTIQKQKFIPNLRTLYRSFAQYDHQVTGSISSSQFEKALNENGIYFKQVDLQILYKGFSNQRGQIDWFQFLKILKIPMNEQRRQLVLNIFDYLAQQNEKVSLNILETHFDPSDIELVKSLKITAESAKQHLVALLHLPDGALTKDQFIAFYDDLNLNFPHDEPFIKYVSRQWKYQPEHLTKSAEQDLRAIVKALRFKLIQKSDGTKDEFLLRKLFNEFDDNKNGHISRLELDLMLKRLQLPISGEHLDPLFKKFDKNESGYIEYEEFKKFIFFDPFSS